MGFYTKTAMRLFSSLSERFLPIFSDLKIDLKRSKLKVSVQEYLSVALLTCSLFFLLGLPIFSFFFGFVLKSFLFSFISSFTFSLFLTVLFFLAFINYPKFVISRRAKSIDNTLPFSTLYMSTLAGSRLPLHQTLKIFSKLSGYGEITKEINAITYDIEMFGIDTNTALERAIERTSSKDFKELLWGILSTNRAGGNLNEYLKEKSNTFMSEYRRRIYEFSHQLTLYIEIYLTLVVIGAIFFTILTAIMSGIAGTGSNIILLQSILIFVFLPLVSAIFIMLIKSATPGGE